MRAPGRKASSQVPRRLGCRLLLVFALVWSQTGVWPLSAPVVRAETSRQLLDKLQQTGDLTLRDTSLSEALFTISENWNVNIVVGNEVEGRINGVFKGASLEEILNSILLSNNYSYRIMGQSLVVMKLDELGDVNPLFETATIRTKSVDPASILDAVKLLSSPQGSVQAIAPARSLLVIDFPDRVRMIRELVGRIDGDSAAVGGGVSADDQNTVQVAAYSPQFVDALSLQQPVQNLLSQAGHVSIMPNERRVVVVDYPANLKIVERMIHELDVAAPQVRITALIYDISLEDLEQLGINWSNMGKWRHNGSDVPQTVFAIDTLTSIPAVAGTPMGAISLLNLSRHFDLGAVILALQQCDDAKLIADPNVTVVDNQPALISIVTEIPYQELTQTSQGGNIGTTSFREAGVKLEVTPHIASDGTISMDVTPSFSRLTGFTPGENPQPIIDRREAKTTVRVVDRQTLVIGGLRQTTEINENNGIPYLKDIPYLGWLFRSRENTMREGELVVFITPEIVTPTSFGKSREINAYGHSTSRLDAIRTAPSCPLSVPGEPYSGGEILTDGPALELSPENRTLLEVPAEANPPATPAVRSARPASADSVYRLPPITPRLFQPPGPAAVYPERYQDSAVANRPQNVRLSYQPHPGGTTASPGRVDTSGSPYDSVVPMQQPLQQAYLHVEPVTPKYRTGPQFQPSQDVQKVPVPRDADRYSRPTPAAKTQKPQKASWLNRLFKR